ncbi:MAG: AAA family ATPase, partial [Gemmataceae bacterium]
LLNTGEGFLTSFRKEHKMGFGIEQMENFGASGQFSLRPEMTQAEIAEAGIAKKINIPEAAPEENKPGEWRILRERCFLVPVWMSQRHDRTSSVLTGRPGPSWEVIIPHVIHLPGLRGNPERTYPVTAVGPTYPGTFEKYTASVISRWKDEHEATLAALNADLKLLKLTGGISAVAVNAVQIELQVGRLPDVPPTRLEDRVNIADVGVGVSQTLPVLVALHAAKPGQLVYVEQPETHLHPRAQFALAQILASAAKRGVRVVVETHSSILLLGVQTLVAEGKLEPDKIKLHWFQREKDGRTVVRTGELDEAGAFGDWPEDFDDVALQTQAQYLDAASARRLHK